jgi:hypothetical protein
MTKPNRRTSIVTRRQRSAYKDATLNWSTPNIANITSRQSGFRSIRYWTDIYLESLVEIQIAGEEQCCEELTK